MDAGKIKKIVSELPRPVLIAILVVFLIFFSTPLMITLLKPEKKKVTPPTPVAMVEKDQSGNKTAKSSEVSPTLLEAKMKEIELLKKQGKYFTGLEGKPEKKEPELPPPPSPPTRTYTPVVPHTVKAMKEKPQKKQEPAYIKLAREIYESTMEAKPALGSIVLVKEEKTGKQESESKISEVQPHQIDPRKILTVGEFYRATVETTVTSASPQAVVIAKLDEGLRNAKLLGRISGIINDENKLNVTFDKLVFNKKVYPVRAIAYSLDKTVGVASELKYNVLAKIFTTGLLAFGQSMTEAMREDEETTIETMWGTEVVQEKSDERLKEGILAGTSSAFGEAKSKTESYMGKKQDVKVILRKGTPIYVIFTKL